MIHKMGTIQNVMVTVGLSKTGVQGKEQDQVYLWYVKYCETICPDSKDEI